MAGLVGAHADEGYANTGGSKDGPVLTMMSKRLRALRKKFNRILQIEENKAQGKTVNKEQEEVLKTKIAIAALIDEYEKLRQPLLVAVKEEVTEREKELMAAALERQDEDESVVDEKDGEVKERIAGGLKEEAGKDSENWTVVDVAEVADEVVHEFANGGSELKEEEEEEEELEAHSPHQKDSYQEEDIRKGLLDADIMDLLKLLYFAQLFDVRSQRDTPAFVWTKVHERSSCLSYDFVTDDATSPLIEDDLDSLSMFGTLLTSRAPNVTLSHKEALERCLDHAKAWLSCSDSLIGPVQSELPVSYARLRERLNRILSSEYFTMTPELQTVSQQTAAAAATAAGQYVTKVLVHEAHPVGSIVSEDGTTYYQDPTVSQQYYQTRGEYVTALPVMVANGIPVASSLLAASNAAAYVPESMGAAVDVQQFGAPDDSSPASSVTDTSPEIETGNSQAESVPLASQQAQYQGQPQGGPRSGGYQGQRGSVRGAPYAGGGRGRVYSYARGGRGGRAGFPNGGRGSQSYEQGAFYPRNNYYGGGRGGRGGRFNGHANGPAPSGPVPAVATGSA